MVKIIIVNTGSASKKYSYYEDGEALISAHFEMEDKREIATVFADGDKKTVQISKEEYFLAFKYFLQALKGQGYLKNIKDLTAIGVRIVAPGAFFAKDRVIHESYLDILEASRETDPVHIEPLLSEIEVIKETVGDSVLMFAISDSAFHSKLPKIASLYALPKKVAEELEIKKYGYHGLSIESIVRQIPKLSIGDFSKMIICHLGGGSSITAISDKNSLDTTMGYSPVDGVIMSTRSGSIDPIALIRLAEAKKLDFSELRQVVYSECGIKGISGGLSDDIRELLKAEEDGNEDAKNALDLYAYSIKKQIGAYMAVLNGLDALIFTGTIGERSAPMRERILNDLDKMGICLDKSKNSKILGGKYANIGADKSKVKILVVPSKENEILYKKTLAFVK